MGDREERLPREEDFSPKKGESKEMNIFQAEEKCIPGQDNITCWKAQGQNKA